MRKTLLGAIVLTAGVLVAPATPASAAATCGGLTVTILGTADGETLNGTEFPDVIDAGAGDDIVNGLGENDTVCLGPGNDKFFGGAGDDVVIRSANMEPPPVRNSR